MTDLSKISDKALILEIYRRIRDDDEMSVHRNYCYRGAFRPLIHAFDKVNADESNMRMYKLPDWGQIERERDEAISYFPEEQ